MYPRGLSSWSSVTGAKMYMKKEVSKEVSPRAHPRGNTNREQPSGCVQDGQVPTMSCWRQRWRQQEVSPKKQRWRSREDEGLGQELRVLTWKWDQRREKIGRAHV